MVLSSISNVFILPMKDKVYRGGRVGEGSFKVGYGGSNRDQVHYTIIMEIVFFMLSVETSVASLFIHLYIVHRSAYDHYLSFAMGSLRRVWEGGFKLRITIEQYSKILTSCTCYGQMHRIFMKHHDIYASNIPKNEGWFHSC